MIAARTASPVATPVSTSCPQIRNCFQSKTVGADQTGRLERKATTRSSNAQDGRPVEPVSCRRKIHIVRVGEGLGLLIYTLAQRLNDGVWIGKRQIAFPPRSISIRFEILDRQRWE